MAEAQCGSMGGPKLESTDPDEYITWRARFERYKNIRRWGHLRTRMEIMYAMKGPAYMKIEHLDEYSGMPEAARAALLAPQPAAQANVDGEAAPAAAPDNNPEHNPATLLVLLDGLFLNAGSAKVARAKYDSAQQLPDEDLSTYASRLRRLYRVAHPDDHANNQGMLIDKFVNSLADDRIWARVGHLNFDSLLAALEACETASAALISKENEKKRRGDTSSNVVATVEKEAEPPKDSNSSVNQMSGGRGGRRGGRGGRRGNRGARGNRGGRGGGYGSFKSEAKCHVCKKRGHMVKDCWHVAEFAKEFQKNLKQEKEIANVNADSKMATEIDYAMRVPKNE